MGADRFVIVDYGMGNLRSVLGAFRHLGCDVTISNSTRDVREAFGLILPGVGAFGEAMANLRAQGLDEAIRRAVLDDGKPLLGICLGMQLLAEFSEERGLHRGLGLLPGRVRRLSVCEGMKLPHIGWSPIRVAGGWPFPEPPDHQASFYFVHSYGLECPSDYVAATCSYGVEFTAAVRYGSIFATQFHPEKSQSAGLRLLHRFIGQAQGRP